MSYEQQYRPSGFTMLPPVVKNLLIINVIMYLANLAFFSRFGIELNDILGLHYPTSTKFHWYQVFTHMFMHDRVNFQHILFNMFAVWMFGYILENYWGPRRFLIFYLITGLGAAFLQIIFTSYQLHEINVFLSNPSREAFDHIIGHYYSGQIPPNVPVADMVQFMNNEHLVELNRGCVGASGALFGILTGFGMLFPNTELIMIFFPIPIKAKYFVMIYAGIELFTGISRNPDDGVAHFAHIGGAIFGFILIKIWQRKRQHFY
ncbi:MAG: rhomboid family intramembrane serine protease [Bacteroidia bacterium]